ncbi:MAG: hypothetical protein R2873_32570 [Caldilineaceae bacterium]
MPRRYTMQDGTQVAQVAAEEIERWLCGLRQTVDVTNVELDPQYQALDVDLLWTTHKRTYQVEIKGDRVETSGNFFFETQSNAEQGTPGCFLYMQADLLFYYFVNPKDLYILPMPQTRNWFLPIQHQFAQRATTTPVGNHHYTTVGRLVPIERVMAEVQDARRYSLITDTK